MTNAILFQALKQVKSLCSNIKDCEICPFCDNSSGDCTIDYAPENWNLDNCAINSYIKTETPSLEPPASSDNLSVWHDGYDTGYKVGKNDTLLKVRDYINEMRE